MTFFDNRTLSIQMASLASCVCNIKPKYRCAYTSEGSNAECGQLITDMKLRSFLTPDLVSKNDARHGIGLSYH